MRQILNLSTVELASINFGSIGQIEILQTIICIWPFKKMCTLLFVTIVTIKAITFINSKFASKYSIAKVRFC